MGGPRRKVIPIEIQWHVEFTPFGSLVMRDQDGNDPLNHPDPVTQAVNMYLAAASPGMKLAIQCATKRHSVIGSPYWRDDEINHLQLVALNHAVTPIQVITRLCKSNRQRELRLEAA